MTEKKKRIGAEHKEDRSFYRYFPCMTGTGSQNNSKITDWLMPDNCRLKLRDLIISACRKDPFGKICVISSQKVR